MATCLIVQHAPAEGPYLLGDALTEVGVEIDLRAVHDGGAVPLDSSGLDGLVVMGGSMSARSDEGFPTRRAELALLADAVGSGVPTLGVCLGAQLLALATGGEVTVGDAGTEIGCGQVRLTDAAADDPLLAGAGNRLDAFHWHGDTLALPPGAVLLASNERYRNQAFRVGRSAWGFQCHVEVDLGAVRAFLDAAGDDVLAIGSDPAAIEADAVRVLGRTGRGARARRAIATRFAMLVDAGPRPDGGGRGPRWAVAPDGPADPPPPRSPGPERPPTVAS